ncbi:hypothetical protein ACHAWU_001797 [Discostella pseudostelligera]|uniref:Peptidylprolyl isomerase n=1 Tax=Discostella pseudostelligera TaxID=259834 RepID=A0ABD3LXY5_9STRA
MKGLTLIAVAISISCHSSAYLAPVSCFSISIIPQQKNPTVKTSSSSLSSCLHMSSLPFNFGQQQIARQNVLLPLVVDTSSDGDNNRRYEVPLPNAHLPLQLATASLYELKLDVPLHRLIIQDRISGTMISDSSPTIEEIDCSYGHVVYTPEDSDGLIGSLGCASEILIGTQFATDEKEKSSRDREDSGPFFVLARGLFRFRVKEIVKSIPYPIAIIDEILDDPIIDDEGNSEVDDDDGDIYDTISSKDLVKQIFQSLAKILRSQADATSTPLSPLEKSILEDAPTSLPMAQEINRRFDAEERIVVFEAFTSSLLDIAPNERDRIFAVAMIAGELAKLPSEIRVKMLTTTNGVERLRLVLRVLSSMLSLDSARKITKSLSLSASGAGDDINIDQQSLQEAEDAQKQLRVGTPMLPPWANQIKKGIRVEYFWNEDEGWCPGTVYEDPVKIVDEIIVTVKFDDDGSIHKLPFRGDDKARWRPPMGNSGAFE